ncbi:MAG: PD-(D/E)XK nuclease family protein [Acidobacteria bacterium]|nr:PD-(D/E)XK nuclease family protein [Acidobacteriota bacterium]MBI3655121.1 PD-(D/E)XK nuclease family protein [Acidobacteriota bacterium]
MVSKVNSYQQRLVGFSSILSQKLRSYREARRRLDRFLSTGFNVFRLIRPDENRLSDIIADLLDPAGSHGQQRVFLDSFLGLIEQPELLGRRPSKVLREGATRYIERSQRRIDVTVHFEDFELGIENKPWAVDEPDQLNDYHSHLTKKYGTRFCLVYVTPNGHRPTSMADHLIDDLIRNHRLRLVSYGSDIAQWVRTCCQLSSSDKFRWFLRDFVDYIVDSFPVSPTMEANDD